jgi:rod shape-determining protein MreD
MAFIVQRFRARLRFFPIWQQTAAVAALLLNDRIVMLMLRSFSVPVSPDLLFWLPALSGALIWPLLVVALDDLRQRLRRRPE